LLGSLQYATDRTLPRRRLRWPGSGGADDISEPLRPPLLQDPRTDLAHLGAPAPKVTNAGLAGHGARVPCSRHVHRDRSRCRRDPCRLPRGRRTVGRRRAAAAVPGDHRSGEGAGMRPHHCRLDAIACGTVPGEAAASGQEPLRIAFIPVRDHPIEPMQRRTQDDDRIG